MLSNMPAEIPNNGLELITHQTRIAVIGAGVGGGFFSLELAHLLKGQLFPKLKIFDRINYLADVDAQCKGCAGGTNQNVIELLNSFDTSGRILRRDGGIFLKSGKNERALSYSEVNTVAIHMPGSGKIFPQVQLPKSKRVIPVFRGGGPKNSKTVDQIGLSAFMLELLKEEIGSELPYTTSKIATIDASGQKPIVIDENGVRTEHDLLILTQGISRGNIKIITKDGEVKIHPPGISAYLKEVEIGDGRLADKMYGRNRNKAHVVIASQGGKIHYVFFLPQKILTIENDKEKIKTVITMAAFSQEGYSIGNSDVSTFLNTLPINFFPDGKDGVKSRPTCGCPSFIPSGPVDISVLKLLAQNNIIAFGDMAGTGKLLKNGIGTTAEQAIAIASSLVENGISDEALLSCVDKFYNMFVPDNNQYGRPLLDWVDNIYNRKYLPPILNFILLVEQFLPRYMQKALPNIAKSSIGISTYKEINRSLQQGLLGHIITLVSLLIGNPLPKVKRD